MVESRATIVVLVEFLRRRGWPSLSIAMFGGYGAYLLVRGDTKWLMCLGAIVATLGMEWLHSRVSRGLERGEATALIDALTSQPTGCPLLDPETGDVLQTRRGRLLLSRWWSVARLPDTRRIADELEQDLDTPKQSTIAYTIFGIRGNTVVASDVTVPVRVSEDGAPETYNPPGSPQLLRGLRRARQISHEDVVALTAQLRRAEPLSLQAEGQEPNRDAS